MFVKGFFPVFFLVYFLQLIFKASTRFIFCFSLVKEKVFDIDSISDRIYECIAGLYTCLYPLEPPTIDVNVFDNILHH